MEQHAGSDRAPQAAAPPEGVPRLRHPVAGQWRTGAGEELVGPKEQGRAARDFFTTTTTVYPRASQAGTR
ncbi:hypothetical protein [Streptomyces sp. NPDC048411]|uniref:hypothetical protein n=1 Tax=Streptomyces sp. NPDC048411 TaxID=3157206 RepID=UPI00345363B7